MRSDTPRVEWLVYAQGRLIDSTPDPARVELLARRYGRLGREVEVSGAPWPLESPAADVLTDLLVAEALGER